MEPRCSWLLGSSLQPRFPSPSKLRASARHWNYGYREGRRLGVVGLATQLGRHLPY